MARRRPIPPFAPKTPISGDDLRREIQWESWSAFPWNSLRRSLSIGLMVVGVFAGCATAPDWKPRVGHYAYDDAVKEYGPPDRKETLADGTVVADWLISTRHIFSTPAPGYYRRRYWGGAMDVYDTPESHLQLTFGPDHKLTAGKQFLK